MAANMMLTMDRHSAGCETFNGDYHWYHWQWATGWHQGVLPNGGELKMTCGVKYSLVAAAGTPVILGGSVMVLFG